MIATMKILENFQNCNQHLISAHVINVKDVVLCGILPDFAEDCLKKNSYKMSVKGKVFQFSSSISGSLPEGTST